jgi:hypothetical protein
MRNVRAAGGGDAGGAFRAWPAFGIVEAEIFGLRDDFPRPSRRRTGEGDGAGVGSGIVVVVDGDFAPEGGIGITEDGGGNLGLDAAGNLYGTTTEGGIGCVNRNSPQCGMTFEITPTGTEYILYAFCRYANCADGQMPDAGLTFGTGGKLYGPTQSGGAYNGGAVVWTDEAQ